MKKILISLLLSFFIILTSAHAKVDTSSMANNIASYFKNPVANDINTEKIQNSIFDVIISIGWIAALFVILITGIKFMTANSQQKAALKEKLWLIVAGIVLLATGPKILQIIIDVIFGSFFE